MSVRFRAGGQMCSERRVFARFEGVDGRRGRQIVCLRAGQPANRWDVGHGSPATLRTMASRSESRPSRTRLLTVPNAVPVRSAISAWVRPPK